MGNYNTTSSQLKQPKSNISVTQDKTVDRTQNKESSARINLTITYLDLPIQCQNKINIKERDISVNKSQKAIILLNYIGDGILGDMNCHYCQDTPVWVLSYKPSLNKLPQWSDGRKLNLKASIEENGLKSGDIIFWRFCSRGAGASYAIHYNSGINFKKTVKDVCDDGRVFYLPAGGDIVLRNYHISCRSDHIPKQLSVSTNMIGIVLYKYDGKTDWYLNGVHCKIGYVIVKTVKSLSHISTIAGTMHSKLYKKVFNEDLDAKKTLKKEIVGAGFAIKNGILKFNSGTFNSNGKDEYHNDRRTMHVFEAIGIHSVLQKWRETNIATWSVCDLNHATYFKDFCSTHLMWSFLMKDIDDIEKFHGRGSLIKDPFTL
eukprot:223472_1